MSTSADLGAPSPEPDQADGEPVDEAPVDEDQVEEPVAPYPPVAAVVVSRNPGPWLEDTLLGLAGQDYPDLTVLVVDCGSDEDPTARIAADLPGAFVRRLAADSGFAAAANEALASVQGATFLLMCHDDVVLDSNAVRVLVEEAYRSNAGIVGPKLVSSDDPEILLEVGRAIDRFGAAYTGIEAGELDQEQHDGVRDVFYVPTAVMLVRVDLFGELEGFDPATFPGSEDLDLCWRARLAGARVLVVPDARAAHREAADDRLTGDRPDELALARTRVRVLLTSYSLPTLLWLVPVGIVVGVIEAVGDLVTGRPRRALAAIGAWIVNLMHFRSWRASRRRAQKIRHVHDRDLRELQVGSTTRLNLFLAHHVRGDDRVQSFSERGRAAVDSMSDGVRTPAAIAFFVFLVLVLVGSRQLVTQGVPSIGTMIAWPSVGDLLDSFGSAWRYTGLGSASPAPALLALMGGAGGAVLGSVGLARTLVVVLAMPVGAFAAYRLAYRVMGIRGPALAAGLVYGVNPVARNAIAEGRLGPLVLFATLPILLSQLVSMARVTEDLDTVDGAATTPATPRRRGRLLRFAILLAFTTAWYPLTPVYLLVAVAAVIVVSPFTGGVGRALRALGLLLAGSLGAIVLLFPWPLSYIESTGQPTARLTALGFVFRPALDLSDVLRFHTGPAGAGWAMWGLLAAAAVPLFVATGPRLAWATRGWALALAGWAVVWVPARFAPNVSVPAPEAGLTLAALGLAIALGIGVSVLIDGIHTFRFGWRQPAAIIGSVAILLPVLGFVADTVDGRWGAPESDWGESLAFTSSLASRGEFRMLWVGNPEVLPLDPVVLPSGTAYSLTRNGPGDSTELLRAPEHDADTVVDASLELTEDGLTNRLGRLLAPAGVRYVVVPASQGRGGGAQAPASPAVRRGLAGQLDLARLRSLDANFVMYENLAWIPLRAVVTGAAADDVPVGDVAPVPAALGADMSGNAEPANGTVVPGIVLWGEAYDSAWAADANGHALAHQQTFGWSNGFTLRQRGEVSIAFDEQWVRWATLAISVVVWLIVIVWWRRTRAPRRPDLVASRERRERSRRPDPLAEVLAEDADWWEQG
jgi:GT2 family glycosyltransferase